MVIPLVTFEDNKRYKIGYVNQKIGNIFIFDVALVEGCTHNMLSIRQFTSKGFNVEFGKDKCLIIRKNSKKISLIGLREGSLFVAAIDSTNKEKICYFYSKALNKECW